LFVFVCNSAKFDINVLTFCCTNRKILNFLPLFNFNSVTDLINIFSVDNLFVLWSMPVIACVRSRFRHVCISLDRHTAVSYLLNKYYLFTHQKTIHLFSYIAAELTLFDS